MRRCGVVPPTFHMKMCTGIVYKSSTYFLTDNSLSQSPLPLLASKVAESIQTGKQKGAPPARCMGENNS
jgi:hypothetical protein